MCMGYVKSELTENPLPFPFVLSSAAGKLLLPNFVLMTIITVAAWFLGDN